MLINSKLKKVKVTAVKFIKSYLYVANGGNLIVYDVHNSDCYQNRLPLININVLQFNNIHGIWPDKFENNICIFGGKYVKVLPTFPADWQNEPPWRADDWIWSVKWMTDSSLVVVTGHNELSILKLPELVVIKRIACEEKCILYSALIVGDDLDKNVVVMSGTVYKEVLIWIPRLQEDNRMIIHRLTGHNGVIFSIDYDPASQRICSTSDDRTVRVWSVVVHSKSSNSVENITNKYLSWEDWMSATVQPLYCIFGHSARVFNSRIISDKRVISISEDSYMCVWDENGNNILKQETHQGGKVCCVDFSENLQLAATGGADGGVSLWPIPKVKRDLNSDRCPVVTTVVAPVVPSRIKSDLYGNFVVAGRNCNALHVFYNGRQEWCEILKDDRIVNYCLLGSSPCRSVFALATITGHVILFQIARQTKTECTVPYRILLEKKLAPGRILSLIWLSDRLLLSCDEKGAVSISRLSFEPERDTVESSLNVLFQFVLPSSKERWVTSAVLFAQNTLVCGDRGGSIHIYRLSSGSDLTTNKEPVQTFYKIHGHLGVTCLTVIGNRIWSCGRDGYIRQFTESTEHGADTCDGKLSLVSADKFTLPWACKIIHSDRLGTLILGFHDVDLMVWSVNCRVILWKYECGGGHREWDCVANDNGLSFHYFKDKIVNSVSITYKDIANPAVIDGFHKREINTLSVLTRSRCPLGIGDAFKDGVIVISGSEDTTLRVSHVSDSSWQALHMMTGHLSSIRAIANLSLSCTNTVDTFLIFSAGGRAQLKIWMLQITYVDCRVDVTSRELCSHMLRGEEKVKRPWKDALPTVDPETRYMDMSLGPESSKELITVCTACSDGYLRIFSYKTATHKLEQLYLFEYQRCLLKSLFLNLRFRSISSSAIKDNCTINDIEASMVIAGGTDGCLTFWNLTDERPIYSLKVHQSGINACDSVFVKHNNSEQRQYILLATGGDDSSIAVNILSIENCEHSYKLERVYCWTGQLHSSQVSGIRVLDDYIITASVDHRISVVQWKLTDERLVVNPVDQRLSVVADIHGIEVWKHSTEIIAVCAFGVGMEVFHITKEPDSPEMVHHCE